MKIFLTTLLAMSLTTAFSQNILSKRTLWLAGQDVEMPGGNMSRQVSSILICKQDSILWKNEQGALKAKFTIKKAIGSWTNISEDGQMIYQVENGSLKGTITVSSTSVHRAIRLLIIDQNGPVISELFINKMPVVQ